MQQEEYPKAPTLGKHKHTENQGLEGQNHHKRREEEGDLLKDEISTKKSLYFNPRTDYKSLDHSRPPSSFPLCGF